jgi:hypothetical protein
VALSTAEAEIVSATAAVQEAIFLRKLIREVSGKETSRRTTLFEDNQACLTLLRDPTYSAKTKHIDIKQHFVKECVQAGTIDLVYCPTVEMVADGLTKPLLNGKFEKFRDKLLGENVI